MILFPSCFVHSVPLGNDSEYTPTCIKMQYPLQIFRAFLKAYLPGQKTAARSVIGQRDCRKKHAFSYRRKKQETSGFLTCKNDIKYGAEGFQRAIGKPFGRARRRETFPVCKSTMCILQKKRLHTLSTVCAARSVIGQRRLSKNAGRSRRGRSLSDFHSYPTIWSALRLQLIAFFTGAVPFG